MRPLRTESLFEGKNGVVTDVASQQLTGIRIGHPFLHPVPADIAGLSRDRISTEFRRNPPKLEDPRFIVGQKDGQRFTRTSYGASTAAASTISKIFQKLAEGE